MSASDLQALAAQNDLPVEALEVLLVAVRRGQGRQAQFSHPALGGMGQWSRDGGTMVGDMFNHDLKAKVARICEELAARIDEEPGGADAAAHGDWWPPDLGRPASVGSQNGQGYAVFPDARRLAVRDRDGVHVYDTKDHRLTGVSQQQSNGTGAPSFRSQHGDVRLDDLSPVGEAKVTPSPRPDDGGMTAKDRPTPTETHRADDVLGTIERLHDLHRKGVLSAEEFADKKKDLLARL